MKTKSYLFDLARLKRHTLGDNKSRIPLKMKALWQVQTLSVLEKLYIIMIRRNVHLSHREVKVYKN